MSETLFNQRIDATFRAIEDATLQIGETCDADIDVDHQGGVLSLQFENGRKLIFSRQAPVEQLWLAAPTGGFHFHWRAGHWREVRSEDTLTTLFNRLMGEMLAQAVNVSLAIVDPHTHEP